MFLANLTVESTSSQPLSSQSEVSGSTSSNNHSGEWISSNWVYDIAKLDYFLFFHLNFSCKKTSLFNSPSILDSCVARNMSCYGSNIIRNNTEMVIMDDQCCESCNDVIKNYQALGWHFDTKHFSQCLGNFCMDSSIVYINSLNLLQPLIFIS